MSPSIWKIPRLLKPSLDNKPINTYLRGATIAPGMIGQTVQVHNGHRFIPVIITEHLVGFKFGQFALTKKRVFHKRKKKK